MAIQSRRALGRLERPSLRTSRRACAAGTWSVSAFCIALLGLSACPAPTEMTTKGTASIDRASDEFVVLYPEDECLNVALTEKIQGKARVYPTKGFQDAMFPWFEREHAPRTLEDLRTLVARPKVAERIATLDVRYLISVAATQSSDVFPGLLCGGGYAGAGCLGLMLDDKKTSLEALIWDLRDVSEAGKLTSTSSGSSAALGIIIPIVFAAYTEEEACRELAASIAGSFE